MDCFKFISFGVVLSLMVVNSPAADRKVRVFVTDSDSWTSGGGVVGVDGLIIGGGEGGARPQTAEIIKTFNQRCPEVTITIRQERADYIVLLDHEGGKAPILRDNKVVVFDEEGDAIYSGSTVILGNAVKDVCEAIRKSRKDLSVSP